MRRRVRAERARRLVKDGLPQGLISTGYARWPGEGAVLPVVESHEQPFSPRRARADLAKASEPMARGERSLRGLPGVDQCLRLTTAQWGPLIDAETFADRDFLSDLQRFNLAECFELVARR